MNYYKYYETVEEKVYVSPCPCCGREDTRFYNFNRDDSVHGAGARVVCNNCGHEVKVDGNEIGSDNGLECQLRAIDMWNSQYRLYRNPDVDALKKELAEARHENSVLKTTILMNGYDITDCNFSPWNTEKMKLYNEFTKIMRSFMNSSAMKDK
jgi:hypothetical protein